MILDIYGRERHPEFSNGERLDTEDYASRRDRAELMLKTFSYVAEGVPPANRIILMDVDTLNLIDRTGTGSTVVTATYGGRPQSSHIIDLNGKIIQTLIWQRPEQNDELLSNLFGLPVGY